MVEDTYNNRFTYYYAASGVNPNKLDFRGKSNLMLFQLMYHNIYRSKI